MITEWDKALVAAIMGIASLITIWWGFDLSSVTEERLLSAIAMATPVIVYFVPNKSAARSSMTLPL